MSLSLLEDSFLSLKAIQYRVRTLQARALLAQDVENLLENTLVIKPTPQWQADCDQITVPDILSINLSK